MVGEINPSRCLILFKMDILRVADGGGVDSF